MLHFQPSKYFQSSNRWYWQFISDQKKLQTITVVIKSSMSIGSSTLVTALLYKSFRYFVIIQPNHTT